VYILPNPEDKRETLGWPVSIQVISIYYLAYALETKRKSLGSLQGL
jgi:hypothetical protein